jgi:nucleoside-diphosphate-sugar epimerase
VTGEPDRRPRTLVMGLPGLTATRVAEALLSQGEPVLGLVREGGRHAPPPGVEVVTADPCAIDLGLSGRDYVDLCARAEKIVYAVEPTISSGSLERAPALRAAAELLELLRGGAGRMGVAFSSSLFVFGDVKGPVSETEFEVGQDFPTPLEEALAVAEKVVRRGQRLVPLSVVRAAPVAGDAGRRQLAPASALSRLAERIRLSPGPIEVEFSDQPVRFETAERLAEVLIRCQQQPGARTLHLIDREPMSDRQLVTWLAARIGRALGPPAGGVRLRSRWRLPDTALGRSILGYPTRFERSVAEAFCPDLLDVDPRAALEAFFAASGDLEEKVLS